MAGRLGALLKGWGAGDSATFAASGERLRRQGQLERAVEVCRDGLKRFPDQLSARVTLGWALLDLRRYDEAREELEYVIRRAPDNLAAIRGLAQLHDEVENSELLALEHAGDWPPRQEDITRAVREQRHPSADSDLSVDVAGATPALGGTQELSGHVGAGAAADADLPESAVELLEEADALEAIADEAELAGTGSPTLDLDPEADVDLEELASELAGPDRETNGDRDRSGASGPEGPDPSLPETAPETDDDAIVLDADAITGGLDELGALGNGESTAADTSQAGSAPEDAAASVRTESALSALERLLNQAKTRRQQPASDSAA